VEKGNKPQGGEDALLSLTEIILYSEIR